MRINFNQIGKDIFEVKVLSDTKTIHLIIVPGKLYQKLTETNISKRELVLKSF